MALTRRQQDILRYLQEQAQFEHPPTLDELCRALGLSSRGSLHKHIQALIEAGLVEPLAGRHRGIRLTSNNPTSEDSLPFYGRIAAGLPREAIANAETLEVPAWLRSRGPCYVLEVAGESMIEAGLLPGDRVVIEATNQARNGDIVVALIDGEEATLKRLEVADGELILHPANHSMQPMRYAAQRISIQGVVTGQMRRY